jgi:hypothetical protein
MMASGPESLRDRFLGWQCRLRQIAMREDGGRPSPGMRPRLLSAAGDEIAAALTVLLVRKQPEESTTFLRFQVEKSADERTVRDRGLEFLRGEYFQQPNAFSDRVVAVLPDDSAIAQKLAGDPQCVLAFDQFSQRFSVPCLATALSRDDPFREAALWHNRVFNPQLPETVRVVAFQPDWSAGTAEP